MLLFCFTRAEAAWAQGPSNVNPPDGPGVYGLLELLELADANAMAIRLQRAESRSVNAAIVEAAIRVPTNPSISAGLGPRFSGGSAGLDVEIGVQQQLEIYGEPGLRQQAAEAMRTEADAGVEEVRWQVHVRVHSLFNRVLVARQRRELAQTFVEYATTQLEIARAQIAAGETSPLTSLVAEAELAQMQETLIQAQQIADSTIIELQVAVAWSNSTPLDVTGDLPPIQLAPAPEELLAQMESDHPSLQRRRMAAAARGAQLQAAERDGRPEPTFGLGWSHESSPGQASSSGSASDIVMFQVSVPLPVARRNQGATAAAQAAVAVAEAELQSSVLHLRGDLLQAIGVLDSAAAGVLVYEESVVPQLRTNLSQLQRAYELGEVDIHVVSQTRQRLLTAMGQYLDAKARYYNAAAILEGLVGTEVWSHQSEAP
jgi:cobalt-zinc-cadmium efflux system outer membrane protein